MERNRLKQTDTLADRLLKHARRLIDNASVMPPGPERDETLRKAQQMETATHLNEWLKSPGLRAPA